MSDLRPRPALDARSVSMEFNRIPALDSLDLAIDRGEVHALLGENGSGKSTFIKILSGYHVPSAGAEIYVAGERLSFGSPDRSYSTGCRFVHQDLGLIEPCSIMDNLCLSGGFPRRLGTVRDRTSLLAARADLELVGLDIDPRTLVRDLTPAMKTGVAVARALRQDESSPVHVLILDEPTATLPSNEVSRLHDIIRRVARTGVGVLYVTHRLDEVFSLADNVTALRNGRKVASRASACLDRKKLIHLLVGREVEEVHDLTVATFRDVESRRIALTVDDLRSRTIDGVSFTVHAGEILGVAGIVGSGREELLGAVFGSSPRERGHVRIGGATVPAMRPAAAMALGIAYLPPDRKTAGGFMDLSARENLTLPDLAPFWRRGWLRQRREADEAASWFERLIVRPANDVELPLRNFSGGNQQRILFGKWLRCRPRVFLLDEPTQGVDVEAKAHLHLQLINAAQDGVSIIVSSADIDELYALCHRIVVLRNGRVAATLNQRDTNVAHIAAKSLDSSTGME